ncbi:MAG: menaquinol oxidoreductase, partial [bacterium]
MSLWFSIFVLLVLVLIPLVGANAAGLQTFFGVIYPYAAIVIFLVGFVYRVLQWAKVPVPFRITTT